MERGTIEPILDAIPAQRQQVARHYGVHPYFTRRPANVVRAYLQHYSREGDLVLDPFGGSGVTAIEALLHGRHAIHNDLNPFANFIAQTIADMTLPSEALLGEAFTRVQAECREPLTEMETDEGVVQRWLEHLPLPENIRLPRTSDAERFFDLFTPRQLAGLALLRQSIDREPGNIARNMLLLAWSAALAKLNRTFLSAKGRAASRGGSSIFSIYRYKVAAQGVELPVWETFRQRFLNIEAARDDVRKQCLMLLQHPANPRVVNSRRDFRVWAHDACTLDTVLEPGTVDYIFTDPPYGAFITYLDLSILWNHWLGFPVPDEHRARETIVGGERAHSEDHYLHSLSRSIETCFRLLKPDRWCSFVFQHWNLKYFAAILDTARACGAELRAAITQTGDVIWSMHKKKHSLSVLGGEMILTFYKPADARAAHAAPESPSEATAKGMLSEVFDACLANGAETFTSEALFNAVVMELWRRRALGCLDLDRREFVDRLEQRGWRYDARTHRWSRACRDDAAPAEGVSSAPRSRPRAAPRVRSGATRRPRGPVPRTGADAESRPYGSD